MINCQFGNPGINQLPERKLFDCKIAKLAIYKNLEGLPMNYKAV